MKIQREGKPPFVIGKRVTIGAVSAALVVAVIDYFPNHAGLIRAFEALLIFALQIWIANRYGVTTLEEE